MGRLLDGRLRQKHLPRGIAQRDEAVRACDLRHRPLEAGIHQGGEDSFGHTAGAAGLIDHQHPVRPGTVTLVVHNAGQILHNPSIPNQDVDKDVPPGQTITVQVSVVASAVPYFCKYHRATGMVGSLPLGHG